MNRVDTGLNTHLSLLASAPASCSEYSTLATSDAKQQCGTRAIALHSHCCIHLLSVGSHCSFPALLFLVSAKEVDAGGGKRMGGSGRAKESRTGGGSHRKKSRADSDEEDEEEDDEEMEDEEEEEEEEYDDGASAAQAAAAQKKSHKKNANAADSPTANADDPVYCICQQPSYGDMVGCDNKDVRIHTERHKPRGSRATSALRFSRLLVSHPRFLSFTSFSFAFSVHTSGSIFRVWVWRRLAKR